MEQREVQPWGSAPTPLIPRSIAESVGYLDAPDTVKEILGIDATLADLYESFWEFTDYINSECLEEIVETLGPIFDSFRQLKIFSNDPFIQSLETLPLSHKTKELLKDFPESITNPQLRIGDLMQICYFEVQQVIELASVIESATISQVRLGRSITDLYHAEHEQIVAISKIKPFFKDFSDQVQGDPMCCTPIKNLSKKQPKWTPKLKRFWSELEDFKPGTLAGETLRHYPVSKLIAQEFEGFNERLFTISISRILTTKKAVSLQDIAHKFNISRERVRQLEEKALTKLKKFQEDNFLPLQKRAESLHGYLGSAFPDNPNEVEKILNWFVGDFGEDHSNRQVEKLLLLWLAGPYKSHENWLLIDKSLPVKTIRILSKNMDQRGFISHVNLQDTLSSLGIRQKNHFSWLEYLGKFLMIDGGLIWFQGSKLDKVYSLLQYMNRPMTLGEIQKHIKSVNVRSTCNSLIKDPRFWRINVQNEFVLSGTEGYEEYTGILDGITKELETYGGQAPINHLVSELSKKFKVKETSIRSYLSTPKFEKNVDGYISIKPDAPNIKIITDITKISACYLSGQQNWCLRYRIDDHALRGSGRSIPNAFSQELGCDIGDKIEVPTEIGNITLSWPIDSPSGASIGSLKMVLDHYMAENGDYLFIIASKPKVTFSFLKQDTLERVECNLVKLALLLGAYPYISKDEATRKIAKALKMDFDSDETFLEEAKLKLISRGEEDLAQLIPKSTRSFDDYIKRMEGLF